MEVERPAINRDEGTTLAFSKQDARKLLDLPTLESVEALRDRAILPVGLQVGMRRDHERLVGQPIVHPKPTTCSRQRIGPQPTPAPSRSRSRSRSRR